MSLLIKLQIYSTIVLLSKGKGKWTGYIAQ